MNEQAVWDEIGRRIRLIRKWRGMNQETLARRMRLTRTSIVNAEAGRQKLPVWNLLKLSEIFDVSPHVWLLTVDDWFAWCRVERVTLERMEYQLVTRTYQRREKIKVIEEVG
jgi:DNA-binding XRE family transcriptional regulator